VRVSFFLDMAFSRCTYPRTIIYVYTQKLKIPPNGDSLFSSAL
jgi:hypothetical protein